MGSMQMPPQQQQMPPLFGVRVSGSTALENRFPWKLLPIDPEFTINIIPGDKSEAKRIEEARQMVTLPAICLPTALPVSDLDEQELKRHRQESLTQMPKIIPLELISVSASSESAAAAAADEEAEKENMMGARAEETAAGGPSGLAIDLGEDMAGEEEDHEEEDEPMEQDERMDQQEPRSPSPTAPRVRRMSSEDVDMFEHEGHEGEEERRQQRRKAPAAEEDMMMIASPEPEEPLDQSLGGGSSVRPLRKWKRRPTFLGTPFFVPLSLKDVERKRKMKMMNKKKGKGKKGGNDEKNGTAEEDNSENDGTSANDGTNANRGTNANAADANGIIISYRLLPVDINFFEDDDDEEHGYEEEALID